LAFVSFLDPFFCAAQKVRTWAPLGRVGEAEFANEWAVKVQRWRAHHLFRAIVLFFSSLPFFLMPFSSYCLLFFLFFVNSLFAIYFLPIFLLFVIVFYFNLFLCSLIFFFLPLMLTSSFLVSHFSHFYFF
jgi:hypothetical protein